MAAAKVRSRSKSVTRSEPEEVNAEGEIQKKTLRSRSKTKAEDSEDVPRKSSRPKATIAAAKVRSRSKSVTRSEPEESNAESEIQKKTLRSRSKTKAEDSEGEPRKSSRPKAKVYPAPSTPQRSLPQTPPKKVITSPPKAIPSTTVELIPALAKESKRSLTVEVVQPINRLPSVPTVSPIREIDVEGDIEPEPETNNHVYPAPSTPPRFLPQTPPKKVIISIPTAVPSTTVELIPALSKLPSIPLHTLTEAELDMTVEEWIRYQMDVEYDKFRRDGERELQRFRNQAEEVRKAIEGL